MITKKTAKFSKLSTLNLDSIKASKPAVKNNTVVDTADIIPALSLNISSSNALAVGNIIPETIAKRLMINTR